MSTRDRLAEIDPELMCLDGFDDALMGYVEGWHPSGERYLVAVYDRDKIIESLIADGLTYEEAVEHFEFNISGAYVGPTTPAFVTLLSGSWV